MKKHLSLLVFFYNSYGYIDFFLLNRMEVFLYIVKGSGGGSDRVGSKDENKVNIKNI